MSSESRKRGESIYVLKGKHFEKQWMKIFYSVREKKGKIKHAGQT